MTRIIRTDTGLELSGHAGYAPAGKDIVCAGITALMGALADSVLRREEEFRPRARADPDIPVLSIVCEPVPERARECGIIYDTVSAGLEFIAETFPENVTFQREEN